jgi:hypothetical protein
MFLKADTNALTEKVALSRIAVIGSTKCFAIAQSPLQGSCTAASKPPANDGFGPFTLVWARLFGRILHRR